MTNLRTTKILAGRAFTVSTTKHRPLKTFAVLLETLTLLAVAASHVAFLDAHLELEGGRVSLLRDVDGFLAHLANNTQPQSDHHGAKCIYRLILTSSCSLQLLHSTQLHESQYLRAAKHSQYLHTRYVREEQFLRYAYT
jgi:hypothetical protein